MTQHSRHSKFSWGQKKMPNTYKIQDKVAQYFISANVSPLLRSRAHIIHPSDNMPAETLLVYLLLNSATRQPSPAEKGSSSYYQFL